MQAIGARLNEDTCDRALGISELGIEGCGLDLELLDYIARWNITGSDLICIRSSRGRDAVNGQIHSIATNAVNRVADNMCWLKWTIKTRVTCKSNPV